MFCFGFGLLGLGCAHLLLRLLEVGNGFGGRAVRGFSRPLDTLARGFGLGQLLGGQPGQFFRRFAGLAAQLGSGLRQLIGRLLRRAAGFLR